MSPSLADLTASLRSLPDLRLWTRAPLAPFTTIGVGGRAEILVTVLSAAGLPALLAVLADSGVPWTVLGAGSNVLVADRGYPGVVLKLEGDFNYIEPLRGGEGCLLAGAALSLPRLSSYAADRELAGLEFACGIPGTVGGAVAMNAGAHGGCLADAVQAVELATPEGIGWVPADELSWEYRRCAFPPAAVVTSVAFGLSPGSGERILAHHRALLRVRRQTQPRGARTFGSTFKNPEGESAGRLLESAGMKGVRRGGAEVSALHANFVANMGDASTADVVGLMVMMREAVQLRHGVSLEPEVRLLGAAFPWQE